MFVEYWLNTRDKPGLLIAMMRALAGNAHSSFEGDFSRCRGLLAFPGASTEETSVLRRSTLWPRQDFVVLPLKEEGIQPILDALLRGGSIPRAIIHVQIERDGRLEFGAYDNFHKECVACGAGVSRGLLEQLRVSGVLRSWHVATPEERQRND